MATCTYAYIHTQVCRVVYLQACQLYIVHLFFPAIVSPSSVKVVFALLSGHNMKSDLLGWWIQCQCADHAANKSLSIKLVPEIMDCWLACLLACWLAGLLACLLDWLLARSLTRLLPCVLACLLAGSLPCLLASMLACLLACLLASSLPGLLACCLARPVWNNSTGKNKKIPLKLGTLSNLQK